MGAANPAGGRRAVARDRPHARPRGPARSRRSPATTCSTPCERGDCRIEETGAPVARPRRPHRLGQRLSRRGAPIVEALAQRRRRRDHRPRRRPGAVPGSADPRVRLGAWTTGTRLGPGHASSAICSSAPARSPAAISPIRASRTSPDLARLGFPIAEVDEDGASVITKVAGSGGGVTRGHLQGAAALRDPRSRALLSAGRGRRLLAGRRSCEVGPDRVQRRRRDRPRSGRDPEGLGRLRDGFIGEGQISYAGPGAVARGRLALRDRARAAGADGRALPARLRFDLIGVDALHGPHAVRRQRASRTRCACASPARTDTMREAVRIGNEVETLYTNGPAGGGGATQGARERSSRWPSALLPRELVTPTRQMPGGLP